MPELNIKASHKPIKTYYVELEKYAQLGEVNEGTVRAAFQNLLQHYCHQFDYRLGTRSALEWIVDQYRVKTDKQSNIVNDPNRADNPQYIVQLIGKVITVSLEIAAIVERLPALTRQ